ncbi:hypothetical protein BDBG_03544 [Blastomyces gilchristii SLH14081]|uniref:GPI anchored protein n=1 Tax=Blastomyces gilchristii (strain SLH14081) TaxID=559298 RepID=A0A179UJV3_BLAGS|nr:uncharacterized protein BDBG_03544 [Blastomyces gilchristii SLH14081]EQL35728.1 hypothetical protein BDFG_02661 [Blastomyces dermatitidis ATCC 26199]OAT07488.1 hypothetical protein BDBG_03544 [Blastomyces gilchristii SLH14081]
MRRLRISSAALAILSILSQSPSLTTHAFPFPLHFNTGLASRDCKPCGFYGQECCTTSQICTTNANNQAICIDFTSVGKPRATEGQWETFTTTFVRTDLVTVTSVGSRFIAAPTSSSQIQCQLELGESACGTICCTAAQACKSEGQCVEAGSSPFDPTVGPSPTPPSRPTSSGDATITTMPTATVPFLPPVGTDGNPLPPPAASTGGGGLSGGAIAGIVIGVIFGVLLLFLICLSACAKGAIAAILALLGLGKKKRESGSSTTHSFSDGDGRPGRTWFGYRPSRPPPARYSNSYSSYTEKSKKSGLFGLGKWTSIGLVLGALAICLGLRSKKKQQSPSSGYSDSYYYYDYSSSSSSSSPPPRSKRSKVPSSRSRSRSTRH